ncbi:MAG: hypothetical protein RIA63_02920 [Cyclobacteriaceae bacterium]
MARKFEIGYTFWDHAWDIDLAFHGGMAGETYNIGGKNERTNNYLVDIICGILDKEKPRKNMKSYND